MKNKYITVFTINLFILTLFIMIYTIDSYKYVIKEVETKPYIDNGSCFQNLKTYAKRLMIVAHPDDETIYGATYLLKDKYTVLCVTCGVVDSRAKEFKEVMKRTDDDYIMLGFVDIIDKTEIVSNWKNEYTDIYNSIKKVIDSDDWNIIVTHNPDGEYGHIHHKKINEIVNNITNKKRLYYFGKWYKENPIGKKINDDLYNKKMNDLISVYNKSQKTAINNNYNMLGYENWVKASDWK